MQETTEILIKARKLIRKERNWCQGALHILGWFSNQYCLVGARLCVAAIKGW